MDRRKFIRHGLSGLSAAAAAPGFAQPVPAPGPVTSVRPFRILMITFRGETDIERGFRGYLASAGVAVDIHSRDTGQDAGKVAAILQEEAAFRPDLITTWGTGVTLAVTGPHDAPARHALSDVPVVFAPVASPVQARIVPRLTGHGRPITGVVHVVPTEVQLRAMQSYLPFTRFGLIYTPSEPNSMVSVGEVREFARRSGSQLIEKPLRLNAAGRPVADGLEDMIAELRREGAQWLYLPPDTFLGSLYPRVAPAAVAQKLPTFGSTELAMRSGGMLVGLVCRYSSVGQLAAAKAVEILVKGRPASALPIETLKRFSLMVNMGVARSLGGLYPPIEMLNQAEFVESAALQKPTS
jgi:putative ABC transport system substrate-binding protein